MRNSSFPAFQPVLEQELSAKKSALADYEVQVNELRQAKLMSDRTIVELKSELDILGQGLNSSEAAAEKLSQKEEEINQLRQELQAYRNDIAQVEIGLNDERNNHAATILQLQNGYEASIQQYQQDNERLMREVETLRASRQPGDRNDSKGSVRDDPTFKQLEANFRALAMHAKELQILSYHRLGRLFPHVSIDAFP
jgi:chromosome segregation ATPase